MSYKLRTRTQKRLYVSSSSTDDDDEYESDSCKSTDPDFNSTIRPRRSNKSNSNDVEIREPRRGALRPRKRRRKLGPSAEEPSTSCRPAKSVKRTIMSWLIDRGIVIENERIYYLAKREGNSDAGKQTEKEVIMKKGRIRRGGIRCECCNEVMTVWDFETHAGSGLQRPYANIFVARTSGSLLQCQDEALRSDLEMERRAFNQIVPQNDSSDKNDDACLICSDGGDLICCEKCPSTFHLSCMGMESIPQGDWTCPYCICKHCGGGSDSEDYLYTCIQCDKKYHWKCYFGRKELDLNSSTDTWLCDDSCKEVYQKLQRLVGVKHELEGGLCWTLLRRMEPGDLHFEDRHLRTECNSKIAIAWEVLNECFRTNIDRHTQINVVQSVVYGRGSNFTRINFRGFYTAILEKNDEIITAASIRVHGTELAEMPFIATRQMYRQKGMSRMLLVTLESMFSVLGVEHLVIPSVKELTDMWKWKCGFSPIDDRLNQKIINYNTLMFPSTVRLQKNLLGDPACSSSAAMEVEEKNDNCTKLALLDLNLEPPEPEDHEIARPVT